ncbi:hypothetical protein GCM10027575_37840 [Phytohabitans suffuscus]
MSGPAGAAALDTGRVDCAGARVRTWGRWCSHDHFVAQPAETSGVGVVVCPQCSVPAGRYLSICRLAIGVGGSVSADRGMDPPLWGPFHTTIYSREPCVRWQARLAAEIV